MLGRLRGFPGHRRTPLDSGWQIASARPDDAAPASPDRAASLAWRDIPHLTTVAGALRALGEWSVDGPARRFDADDWWYRLRFDAPAAAAGSRHVLGFDGLATVATVWLNDREILASDNMFVGHEVALDATALRATGNEILIRFRSLDALLAARRPRPRWRTPMLEHQQLRWFRTTVLGRTPGWSPPAAPVGPWRPVWIETRDVGVTIDPVRLAATLDAGRGVVEFTARVSGDSTLAAELEVEGFGARVRAPLVPGAEGQWTARLEIRDVHLWWPHTHGEPARYDCRLHVTARPGAAPTVADLGRIGFRTLELDTTDGDFSIRVNGERVFCRGACWTPLDCVAPGDDGGMEAALEQVRAAGMNMLRVGGTMVYESDRFYDACDALGILVWQDLMFASMDYPIGDAAFDANVRRESGQLLARIGDRPCLALLCGNSEVEQQAAMWGAPRESWRHPLFHDVLPAALAASPVPYWPSSTHGGAFPHQSDSGTCSYYGVGAYRRPLDDARRSHLRFAAECLGFANVPEDATLDALNGGATLHAHHPLWKARVPRDLGAAWDFDDVRDHYFRALLGVDPLDVRYSDRDRFMDLSRVISGEVMAAAFREWRRGASACRGALVWFLRDLWRGAGWGIVDSDGVPKAPYYFLRRVLQPRAVLISDEGVNGLCLHLLNESATPLRAALDVDVFRANGARVARHSREVTLAPRETRAVPALALFDGFSDLSHAYRFGPLSHEVVVARLRDLEGGAVVSEDFYFPGGLSRDVVEDVGLSATVTPISGTEHLLTLRSRACARHVVVRGTGFVADDQYFHIAPGGERTVRLRLVAGQRFDASARALNAASGVRLDVSR